MPFSMVLHVRLMEDCLEKEFHGALTANVLQGLLKKYAQGEEKEVAQLLKDYTFSPLYIGERSLKPLTEEAYLKPNMLCWLRISCLEEKHSNEIFNTFYQQVITKQVPVLETDVGELKVERAIANPKMGHPWVKRESLEELYDNASSKEVEALIDFVSPTLFVYQGLMTPLPIPQLIFMNLGKVWNRIVTEFPISEEELKTLAKHVTLISYKGLSTRVHPIGGGKHRVGFTGRVRVRLVGVKKPELIKYFNLLCDALFYIGSGQAIQLGCGMARRIPKNKWKLLREPTK